MERPKLKIEYDEYINKSFENLTVEEIRYMRRDFGVSITLEDFLEYYNITATYYCKYIHRCKGIGIRSDERKLMQQETQEELKKRNKPKTSKTKHHRGAELKAYRLLRGYNIKELSRAIWISYVSLLEAEGRRKVSDFVADRYIKYLKISPSEMQKVEDYLKERTEWLEVDREIPRAIKQKVRQKYNGACAHCGETKKLHFHHKKHFADGGLHTVDNLMLLCPDCHAKEHEGETAYNLLKALGGEG